MVLAALNVAGPLTLVAVAIVGLNASMAAILNATTPLFTVVAQASGSVIASHGGTPSASRRESWGSSSYSEVRQSALTARPAVRSRIAGRRLALRPRSVYARRAFPDDAPLTVALGQQVAATVLMVPATLAALALSPPSAPVTRKTVMAVLVVGVGATAGGYLLYFWIIRTAGPLAASTVTFVVPLAGAILGVAWLNEPLTSGLMFGLVAILMVFGLPRRLSERTSDGRVSAATMSEPCRQ